MHDTIVNARKAAASLALVAALAACGVPADSMSPLPADGHAFRLGVGDQLRITTFGEAGLSGDVRVNDSGRVALPLAGEVEAADRTPAQLAEDIVRMLKTTGLYRDPKVSVEVESYRPVFVLGEVAKPGQYPYQPGMTALTAVAVAGGFTYRAVTDRFSVVRAAGATATEGRATRGTPLAPNDVLTIYERMF